MNEQTQVKTHKKIYTQDWDRMSNLEKTQTYFARLHLSYASQAKWWNDFRSAFMWFRDNFTEFNHNETIGNYNFATS